MNYSKGFYKLSDDLLYGPNFVSTPTYELFVSEKDTYTYPVDGWYWFDTLEEACNHFGVDIKIYQQEEILTTIPL